MSTIQDIDKAYVANTYNRFPVEIQSGHGAVLHDTAGKEYIDLGTGIGVNAFGYTDDIWKDAVVRQLSQLQHASNLYYTAPCGVLAKMLCERTGMSKVFFGNSGAEANECAIKTARKYAEDTRGKGHHVILTMQNGFHGRTITTLAATGQEHYHELFQPLTPGFEAIPANDIMLLQNRLAKGDVAAVMMECIQGEGGVRPLETEYIRAASSLTARAGALLIIDEVQTGNGRTGKLYSYMHHGIRPDLVTTAKGLGGGLPLGACLMGEKVQRVLGFGDHGSTFGGNPVCCAGAISVLSRLTDSFLEEVTRKGKLIRELLQGNPGVAEISGEGLMLGILPRFRQAGEIVQEGIQNGILCLTAKNRVRLLPPLNIPEELLRKAIGILAEILEKQA